MSRCRVQPPWLWLDSPKDAFTIDLAGGVRAVPCGSDCAAPPAGGRPARTLRTRRRNLCPGSAVHHQHYRTNHLGGPDEVQLSAARTAQTASSPWRADYRATRPKVGTEACPLDAPPPRRPLGPGPRPDQGRCRLRPAGRRDQPCPIRHARHLHRAGANWKLRLRPEAGVAAQMTSRPATCPHTWPSRSRNRQPRQPDSPETRTAHDHALPPTVLSRSTETSPQ